jgi:hypothetical protein
LALTDLALTDLELTDFSLTDYSLTDFSLTDFVLTDLGLTDLIGSAGRLIAAVGLGSGANNAGSGNRCLSFPLWVPPSL